MGNVGISSIPYNLIPRSPRLAIMFDTVSMAVDFARPHAMHLGGGDEKDVEIALILYATLL